MVWLVLGLLLFPSSLSSATVEENLYAFLRSFFSEKVEVKFNAVPMLRREGIKVRHVSFARLPDVGGGTLCVYYEEAGRLRKVFVPFQVAKKTRVLVARRPLKRGEQISLEDIEEKEILIEGGRRGIPVKQEEVIGRRLRTALGEGEIVTLDALEDRPCVEKGQLVDLLFEDERLFIRTKGKALERGRVGDLIRVKNAGSGKEIVGRIVDAKTVSVN